MREAWLDWVSRASPEDQGHGFPQGEAIDEAYPALPWVRAQVESVLQEQYDDRNL